MSSDDLADRTLPPTERRRREARSRGEVARSPELTAAVILLTTSVLLWLLAPVSVTVLGTFMRNSLTASPSTSLTIGSGGQLIRGAVGTMATILVPVVLVLLTSGLAANLIQTGWLWTPSAVSPRLRGDSIFSWGRIGEAIGRLCLLMLLSAVTWRFVATHTWQLRSAGLEQPSRMLFLPARLLGELCIQLSLCLLMYALVDYGVRFWRNEQRLKMTVEERRAEQREEGVDPEIKRRRAALTGGQSSSNTVAGIDPVSSAKGP